MKKTGIILITLILILSAIVSPCAATSQTESEIVYLEDGSYYITTLVTSQNARSSTINGRKTRSFYASDDTLLWTFVLEAMFLYDPGVSASCLSANCRVDIADNAWYCASKSASPSGNRAVGHAEVCQKLLLVTIQTVPANLTITCDTYGKLS